MNNANDNVWLEASIAKSAYGLFGCQRTLTPNLAGDLLKRNPENRSISQARVDIYANDIKAGRWAMNAQPIIVSLDGKLTDGQHRCAAVVQAGIPIETAFMFGVDYETRKTTDQLRPKTAGDYAGMDGRPNAMGQAAIARMVIAYDKDKSLGMRGVTQGEILEFINANQEGLSASASISHSRSTKLRNIVAPSILGFVHFLTSRVDEKAADEFADLIITGENLTQDDPAMVARNRLIAIGKSSRTVKSEILLHSWNARRRGQKRVMARTTGKLPAIV